MIDTFNNYKDVINFPANYRLSRLKRRLEVLMNQNFIYFIVGVVSFKKSWYKGVSNPVYFIVLLEPRYLFQKKFIKGVKLIGNYPCS